MFWGLVLEPNKMYTETARTPFHISQAALDICTGDTKPCQVMVIVGRANFLVCTLQKNKTIQVPLDLCFMHAESVRFFSNGQCNVHLTGYMDPDFEDEEEEAKKEEEEDSNNVSAKKKLKKEKPAQADSSDDDDDEEDHLQNSIFSLKEEDDKEEEYEEAEEEEADSDGEAGNRPEATLDTSKEDAVDIKSQRRKLGKKLKQQQEQGKALQVDGVDKTKNQPDGQQQKDKKKQQDGKKEEAAGDKKEKKVVSGRVSIEDLKVGNGPVAKPGKTVVNQPDGKQQKDKKKQQDGKKEEAAGDKKEKKVASGGVSIEDLKVGNGPVAKPGKTVAVYYEARLNNKMFDKCAKGAGFKFRLGAKEVIRGWEVGVAGMKVGGKRRIICPPAMAYGARGSPPLIPPNSTLVFEMELKNVK